MKNGLYQYIVAYKYSSRFYQLHVISTVHTISFLNTSVLTVRAAQNPVC